jgi:hypothetical protein
VQEAGLRWHQSLSPRVIQVPEHALTRGPLQHGSAGCPMRGRSNIWISKCPSPVRLVVWIVAHCRELNPPDTVDIPLAHGSAGAGAGWPAGVRELRGTPRGRFPSAADLAALEDEEDVGALALPPQAARNEGSCFFLLVADAYHAALAIERGCELVTVDGDFARFLGAQVPPSSRLTGRTHGQ